MLDRFETEILLHIFSFLPSPSVVAILPLRINNLCSLCLVSKRLRDVAQPVLWRAVAVKIPSQVAALSNETAMLREHIRVLSIEVGRKEGELAMALTVATSLSGLEDLRLTSSFQYLPGMEAVWAAFSAVPGKLSLPALVFEPH
jgi:hypothetical protein